MLRGITARQFNEWRAYDELEPFGEVRDDYRTASIVQAFLNVNRRKKKPIELKDCVLRFGIDAEVAPQTADQARAEIISTMNMLTVLFSAPSEKSAPRAKRTEAAP